MGRFKMENDRLVVTIDDLGAELVSIYDKKYSRELIWQGDPAWWKRQAPILFPNVGKFYGGEYLYQGRHYVQDQHGFARDYMLERVEESPASVTHRLVSNAERIQVTTRCILQLADIPDLMCRCCRIRNTVIMR